MWQDITVGICVVIAVTTLLRQYWPGKTKTNSGGCHGGGCHGCGKTNTSGSCHSP